jgi:hypothetical protein
MKWLFFITVLFIANTVFAQQKFDIESWKKKDGSKKRMPPIQQRDFKEIPDSILNAYMPGKMPNAFDSNLPAAKLVGKTANGFDIYILPLDNMPMVKPDSTYSFNMPIAGFLRRKSAQ